jgi:hypothetical protein
MDTGQLTKNIKLKSLESKKPRNNFNILGIQRNISSSPCLVKTWWQKSPSFTVSWLHSTITFFQVVISLCTKCIAIHVLVLRLDWKLLAIRPSLSVCNHSAPFHWHICWSVLMNCTKEIYERPVSFLWLRLPIPISLQNLLTWELYTRLWKLKECSNWPWDSPIRKADICRDLSPISTKAMIMVFR